MSTLKVEFGSPSITKQGKKCDNQWFRYNLFPQLNWKPNSSGEQIAVLPVNVTILGQNYGLRKMKANYDASRAKNNSAPTFHIYYDTATRFMLEQTDLTGHTVRLVLDFGSYSLEIL